MAPNYTEESLDNFMKRIHEEWDKEFREKYIKEIQRRKKLESPYVLNGQLLEKIKILDESYDISIEKEVLNLINLISDYPDMSTYQLSLSQKALAECYLRHGITGNALEFFEDGLTNNPNLPVKRQIRKLKDLSADELVYSLDKNAIYQNDSIEPNCSSDTALQDDSEYDEDFERYIDTELEKLGPEYREAFSSFLRSREFEKDFQLPYVKWVELTLQSFWDSKKTTDTHNLRLSAAKNLDFNKPGIIACPNSDLSPDEMLFLQYLHHKKTSLDGIAGYWTYEYHMDYEHVIPKFFALGFLQYADLSYSLQKSTIAEMEKLLPEKDRALKMKKSDLIQFLLSMKDMLSLDPYKKMYYEVTPTGKEYLNSQDYPKKDVSFRF